MTKVSIRMETRFGECAPAGTILDGVAVGVAGGGFRCVDLALLQGPQYVPSINASVVVGQRLRWRVVRRACRSSVSSGVEAVTAVAGPGATVEVEVVGRHRSQSMAVSP